jgi:hypothetical protein
MDPRMALRWLAVGLAFGIPFLGGIGVQAWLEHRNLRNERLVPFFYLLVPLASALTVAIFLRDGL